MNVNASSPTIVIGMHRSGTTLVARILSELGVHMGNEVDVHHEAVCFKRINRCLLDEQGSHWANPKPFLRCLHNPAFTKDAADRTRLLLSQNIQSYGEVSASTPWGWKDPRTTLTLPIWLAVYPDARVIHVIRNGIDVALSAHRRETRKFLHRPDDHRLIPPTILAAYHLWELYVRIGQSFQLTHPHFMSVRYEDLVACPEPNIRAMADFLSIEHEGIASLAHRIIERAAKPSRFEISRVHLLARTHLIDLDLLYTLGYELP